MRSLGRELWTRSCISSSIILAKGLSLVAELHFIALWVVITSLTKAVMCIA